MTSHRIIISDIKRAGHRGPLYRVSFGGAVLIEGTTQPLLDAARVLHSMGLTGTLEMWDEVRRYPRMRGDIEKLAELTVREGDGKPRLQNFKSFALGQPDDGDFGSVGMEVPENPEQPLAESSAPLEAKSSRRAA